MKRIMQIATSIIFIISLMLVLIPSAVASGGFVTASDVNLRSGASTDSGIIRALMPGTTVEVTLHDPAGWSRVVVHGDSGYIRSDLIKLRNGTGSLRTTTDGVRVRENANTEARILKVLELGTRVDVLNHNPAGWSRVNAGGVTGFIRSDFLTATANFVAGSGPSAVANPVATTATSSSASSSSTSTTTLMTRVNAHVRSGPSTNNTSLRVLPAGTNVTVLEHNPSSWSRVNIGNTTGYIKSDLLVPPGTPLSSSSSPRFLLTTTSVNVRSGPSTNHSVVRQLAQGTSVEVLGTANGWSSVRIGGSTTGYIRADLLGTTPVNPLELANMSVINSLARSGTMIRVHDIRTGISYNMRVLSGGRHLDVDTATQADTNAKFQSRGGRWSWDARPVRVTIGNRTFAAAINGMPHGVTAVRNNGINGHFCIWFPGSTSNGGGGANYAARMHAAVAQAWASR